MTVLSGHVIYKQQLSNMLHTKKSAQEALDNFKKHMTKTYRIRGREIQGFVHRQHKFHPSDFVEERFNQLLEALEDKVEECRHEISGECVKCGKDALGSKQSTSLKENLADYLTENMYDSSSEELAISILSLLQSHLVKEIEKLEVQIVDDWTKEVGKQIGYSLNKEDIIKIISNL